MRVFRQGSIKGIALGIRTFGAAPGLAVEEIPEFGDASFPTDEWGIMLPFASLGLWFLSFVIIYRCPLTSLAGIYETFSWSLSFFFCHSWGVFSGWKGLLQLFNLIYLLPITGWRLKTWALWSEKTRKALTPGASLSSSWLKYRCTMYSNTEGDTASGLSVSREHNPHSDANFSVIKSVWGTKKKKIFKTSLVNYRRCRWCPAVSCSS